MMCNIHIIRNYSQFHYDADNLFQLYYRCLCDTLYFDFLPKHKNPLENIPALPWMLKNVMFSGNKEKGIKNGSTFSFILMEIL